MEIEFTRTVIYQHKAPQNALTRKWTILHMKNGIVTINANGQGMDFDGHLRKIHTPKQLFELVQAIE